MPYQYGDIQVYYFGEEGSGFLRQKEIQDYEKIRAECKAKGTLWVDPLFEPSNEMLYDENGANASEKYTLVRPKDMFSQPKFFINGHDRFDAVQGKIGDCWLIASISALASLPENIFYTVVPRDQEFDENYAGVFHFRFWKYGKWVDVVVDDRLPQNDDGTCFAHCGDNGYGAQEFWVSLLEKAYAKLFGSYGALKAGIGTDALEEFTGGVAEMYRFYEPPIPENLFEQMLFAYKKHWPMVCCTPKERNVFRLQPFHSYTVTGVENVKNKSGDTVRLVRLRNPYGEDDSRNSIKWNTINVDEKKRINWKVGYDYGEFWMAYEDFIRVFRNLQICRHEVSWNVEGSRSDHNGSWRMEKVEGEWKRWSTAGGCADYSSYTENPMCKLKVYEMKNEEKEEVSPGEANKYHVFIALMQNHRKSQRAYSRKHNEIGFNLYQMPGGSSDCETVIKSTQPLLQVCGLTREVSKLAVLCAGEYIIVPFPQQPHVGSEFVLRAFSPNAITIGEIPRKQPIPAHLVENVEEELDMFYHFAGDKNEIDWRVLKDMLDSYMKKDAGTGGWFESVVQGGIPEDVCRSLLVAYDGNASGELSFDEFRELWIDVVYWKNVFVELSKSKPGYLSLSELDKSIRSTYFKLTAAVDCLSSELITKFGSDGYITFPNYLMCAIRFITIIKNLITDDEAKANLKKELADWFTNPIPVS